jgi:hypothetical protein
MPKTLPKRKTPPETVVAITTFGTQHGVVHEGDKFAGDDPLVLANPSWFCDADMPTHQRPNIWTDMPAPPEQVASPGFNVQVQSIQIPRIGRSAARLTSGIRASGHQARQARKAESHRHSAPRSGRGRFSTSAILSCVLIPSGSSGLSVTW